MSNVGTTAVMSMLLPTICQAHLRVAAMDNRVTDL